MKDTGLSVSLCRECKPSGRTLVILAASLLPAAGTAAVLSETFTAGTAAFAVAVSVLTVTVYSLLLGSRAGDYLMGAHLLAVAAASAVMSADVRAQVLGAAETVINHFGLAEGRMLAGFEGSRDPLLLVCAASSLLSGAISLSAGHRRFLYVLPQTVLFALAAAEGLVEPSYSLLVLFAGTLVLYVFCHTGAGDGTEIRKIVTAAALTAAVLAVSLASGAAVRNAGTEGAYADVSGFFHGLLYESGSVMPEGRLARTGAFERKEKTALKVTFSAPRKTYIKGYTGEVYTGSGWQALPEDTVAESTPMFYWLGEDGFSPFISCSSAAELTGKGKEASFSVKCEGACRKYQYLPYGIIYTDYDYSRLCGDAAMLRQSDAATGTLEDGGLAMWYQSQYELSNIKASGKADGYLRLENAYRDYVYEHYLDVPDETYAMLGYYLGDAKINSFKDIADSIRDCLEDSIGYDESVRTDAAGKDFLAYLFEDQRSGWSVHYATAATMMLRYYGIPARYAEGYYISADDAQNILPGEEYDVSEAHAHAWCEYYLDGIGWIPFEATPGYVDDELDEAAFAMSGMTSKVFYQKQRPKTNVTEKETDPEDADGAGGFAPLPEVIAAVSLTAVAALMIFVMIQRAMLKRAFRRIGGKANGEASADLYGYAVMISEKAGIPVSDLCGYDEAKAINDKAIFSLEDVSDGERLKAEKFAEEAVSRAREKWSLKERLRYKYIDCIYIK